MDDTRPPDEDESPEARLAALHDLEDLVEVPMIVLGLIWLVLLVVELAWGLTPALEVAVTTIWVIFLLDVALKLALAPSKAAYLRREWFTVVALLVPALRVLRFTRSLRVLAALRGARGLHLVRVVSSLNRGFRGVGRAFERRGAGYVATLTGLVAFGGAAGMYAFERGGPGGFEDYGSALWWTAMLLTTMGSESWPRTTEGRILCLLLSVYGFAMFGYVTAALASLFVARDREGDA